MDPWNPPVVYPGATLAPDAVECPKEGPDKLGLPALDDGKCATQNVQEQAEAVHAWNLRESPRLRTS